MKPCVCTSVIEKYSAKIIFVELSSLNVHKRGSSLAETVSTATTVRGRNSVDVGKS